MSYTLRMPMIALSMLVSGCASTEPRLLAPAHTQTVRDRVALMLSVRGTQTDSHHIETVVRVENRSQHTVYLFGYPAACAVPGRNPAVLVLDKRGNVIDPPTPTGASCPYPLQYPLAPGSTVRQAITVDLHSEERSWLNARVILAERTGLRYLVETKRLQVFFAANS